MITKKNLPELLGGLKTPQVWRLEPQKISKFGSSPIPTPGKTNEWLAGKPTMNAIKKLGDFPASHVSFFGGVTVFRLVPMFRNSPSSTEKFNSSHPHIAHIALKSLAVLCAPGEKISSFCSSPVLRLSTKGGSGWAFVGASPGKAW